MTAGPVTDPLAGLCSDGDTVEVAGRTVRLSVVSDGVQFADLAEMGDCYGHTAWCQRDPDYGRDRPRPDGFDGNAEKLHLRDGSVWWQPDPEGGTYRVKDPAAFAAFRQQIVDILEYGFMSYGLELLDGTDAYGRPVVTACAWIGGVEPFADAGYVEALVADRFAELDDSNATVVR